MNTFGIIGLFVIGFAAFGGAIGLLCNNDVRTLLRDELKMSPVKNAEQVFRDVDSERRGSGIPLPLSGNADLDDMTERYFDPDDKCVPDEVISHGYYFTTFGHNYAIEIVELEEDIHVKIHIHYTGSNPDNDLVNLEPIKFYAGSFEHEYTMDIWGKYYFIKYEETHSKGYQLYHGDNEIEAQAEVLKADLEFGIKLGKITLY